MKTGPKAAPLVFGAIVLAIFVAFLLLIVFWGQIFPGPHLTSAPGP